MKNLKVLAIFVSVQFLFSFSNFEKEYGSEKKVIYIDVGHGGKDSGLTIEGITEKQLVLEIAKKIIDLNTNPNIEIHLTRLSDDFVSLENRVKSVNAINPDAMISLHINGSNIDQGISGYEIYVSEKSKQVEGSKELAQKLLFNFQKNIKKENVIVKTSNFYMLKNVEVPAAVLYLGYLSNDNDRKFLSNEEGQITIANNILQSIYSLN